MKLNFEPIQREEAINSLTERERDILLFICEGWTSAEMAEKFFVRKKTLTNIKAILSRIIT